MANLLFAPVSLLTDYRRGRAKGLGGLHRQPMFEAVDVCADFGVRGQDGFDGRVQDVGDALFDVRDTQQAGREVLRQQEADE